MKSTRPSTPRTPSQSAPGEPATSSLDEVRKRFPKVLLVDDSKFLADTLAVFFRLDGFSARAAYGGTQALEEFEKEIPDIAFIDIAMPVMGGLEVARQVRASGQSYKTLLVALTGWEEDPVKREAKEAGFDYFMPKPVDPASIRAFMSRLVSQELDQ